MNVSARMPSRLVLTIAFTITALLLGIIGAVAAGTGTVTPPPKIAFVTTNADIAPDALTVGPMAGRLGAPLFITDKHNLGEDTRNALVAYGPQLIIIAGGPNTVTDAVLAQISAATGLTIEQFDDKPSSGIIRAFGFGRDQTAARLSELIANYNPKFLPTDATAKDSDLLDGKDASSFLQRGGQYEFQVRDWRSGADGDLVVDYAMNSLSVTGPSSIESFVISMPDLPKTLFGVTMAVKSYSVCYRTNGASMITFLNGGVWEQTTGTSGSVVAEALDTTDRTDDACRTQTLSTPTSLAGNRYFTMAVGIDVGSDDDVDLGSAVVTLVPAP